MIEQSILKWGSEEQKQRWLASMGKGEILGALALTEPDAGSDASSSTIDTNRRVIN